MQYRSRILVIDDEPDMCDMLSEMLALAGFDCVVAEDAASGVRMARQRHPDAIILDVMMPRMSGFEACERLREVTDVPILFLTGKATSTQDVIKGFSVGADEYVTKPFSQAELISRLTARLRRQGGSSVTNCEYLSPSATIILDCARHELTIDNRRIYLPPKEYQVLELLIRHAGKVLSRDAILAQVWGPDQVGRTDLVKSYIYWLRKRIEPDPASPRYIHSVRGEGYCFEA
jgi:two-component system response regulator RegX3